MASYTRRTHIVRIPASDTPPGKDPGTYVDVEVLDAVAFRTERGQEVILSFNPDNISPYINDNTGDGNQKTPERATRRSHMQRVTSTDGKDFADFEILDAVAFRDKRGEEWILNLPAEGDPDAANPESEANEYNSTTGVGTSTATRRVHNEKISTDLKKPSTTEYLTVTRVDAVAFRTKRGEQMILHMPSNDDPNASDPRASTYTTPQGYDPTDNSKSAVKPPLLSATKDKNIYVYIPKKAGSLTGLKTKRIAQGPLWWIRKVSGGKYYLLIEVHGAITSPGNSPPAPPTFSVSIPDGNNAKVIDTSDPTVTTTNTPGAPTTQSLYYIWINGAHPLPDMTNFGNHVDVDPVTFGGQFGQLHDWQGNGFQFIRPTGANPNSGFFDTPAHAASAAFDLNRDANDFSVGEVTFFTYFPPDNGPVVTAGFGGYYSAQLDIVTPGTGVSGSSVIQQILVGPIDDGDSTVTVNVSGPFNTTSVQANLYANQGGDVKSRDDITVDSVAADSVGGRFTTYKIDIHADGTDNSTVTVTASSSGGGAL